MADYMVGKGGSSKDRYMVGWNESKSKAYKVGGGSAGVSQGSKALPGDQDPVVGSKSSFSHAEKDTKDDGSESVNMGFGGQIASGVNKDANGAGGQIQLTYAEKGDWSDSKNAMAKRKAQMDAFKTLQGDSYKSPTVDLVKAK